MLEPFTFDNLSLPEPKQTGINEEFNNVDIIPVDSVIDRDTLSKIKSDVNGISDNRTANAEYNLLYLQFVNKLKSFLEDTENTEFDTIKKIDSDTTTVKEKIDNLTIDNNSIDETSFKTDFEKDIEEIEKPNLEVDLKFFNDIAEKIIDSLNLSSIIEQSFNFNISLIKSIIDGNADKFKQALNDSFNEKLELYKVKNIKSESEKDSSDVKRIIKSKIKNNYNQQINNNVDEHTHEQRINNKSTYVESFNEISSVTNNEIIDEKPAADIDEQKTIKEESDDSSKIDKNKQNKENKLNEKDLFEKLNSTNNEKQIQINDKELNKIDDIRIPILNNLDENNKQSSDINDKEFNNKVDVQLPSIDENEQVKDSTQKSIDIDDNVNTPKIENKKNIDDSINENDLVVKNTDNKIPVVENKKPVKEASTVLESDDNEQTIIEDNIQQPNIDEQESDKTKDENDDIEELEIVDNVKPPKLDETIDIKEQKNKDVEQLEVDKNIDKNKTNDSDKTENQVEIQNERRESDESESIKEDIDKLSETDDTSDIDEKQDTDKKDLIESEKTEEKQSSIVQDDETTQKNELELQQKRKLLEIDKTLSDINTSFKKIIEQEEVVEEYNPRESETNKDKDSDKKDKKTDKDKKEIETEDDVEIDIGETLEKLKKLGTALLIGSAISLLILFRGYSRTASLRHYADNHENDDVDTMSGNLMHEIKNGEEQVEEEVSAQEADVKYAENAVLDADKQFDELDGKLDSAYDQYKSSVSSTTQQAQPNQKQTQQSNLTIQSANTYAKESIDIPAQSSDNDIADIAKQTANKQFDSSPVSETQSTFNDVMVKIEDTQDSIVKDAETVRLEIKKERIETADAINNATENAEKIVKRDKEAVKKISSEEKQLLAKSKAVQSGAERAVATLDTMDCQVQTINDVSDEVDEQQVDDYSEYYSEFEQSNEEVKVVENSNETFNTIFLDPPKLERPTYKQKSVEIDSHFDDLFNFSVFSSVKSNKQNSNNYVDRVVSDSMQSLDQDKTYAKIKRTDLDRLYKSLHEARKNTSEVLERKTRDDDELSYQFRQVEMEFNT